MNANVTKYNAGKLLVAVLAMAMLVAGATVVLSDNTDAAETSYIHGGLTAGTSGDAVNVQTYSPDSVVIVDGDYVIPKYAKLVINGSFTVESGYTVTIEPGGQLEFGDKAKVTINGTIEAEGNYTAGDISGYDTSGAIINNAKYSATDKTGVTIAGSLILDNESIMSGNAGNIFVKGSANVEINDGSKVTGQSFILDNGATLLYNGITDATGFKITMNTSGDVYSTVEAELKATSGNNEDISDLKFTASSKNITGYTWDDVNNKAKTQTIKQFTLGVSGTLDNAETLTFTQKVVNNIKDQSGNITFYTSAQYAEDYTKLDTPATVFMYDSLVKGKVAVDDLKIENGTELSNSAYMTVNGKITVSDVPKNADAGVVVGKVSNDNGIVEVVGSIVLAPESFDGADAAENYGTIAINGGTVQYQDGTPGGTYLYGAYYFDDDKNMNISSLDAALTGAVADGADEVFVYATAFSEDIKVGSYIINANLTIPEDVDLVICNGLVVGEGVTVTIPADNKVDVGDSTADGMIYVDGKIIDNSRELEDAEDAGMTFQVKIVTGEGRNAINTYTSLKTALAETTSGTIYLYDEVLIEGTMTIPEGVTIQYAEDLASPKDEAGIELDEGATLNVNGVLFLDGGHDLTATAKNATVNVGNYIKYSDGPEITGTVAGAYFNATLGEDDTGYNYISSVAFAAQNSTSIVDTPSIDIKYNVTMGAVTFTAADDVTLTINIVNDAEYSGNQKATGDVTLVGKVVFDMTAGKFDGTVTSTVTAGTTTIDFDNSIDGIVSIASTETVDGVNTEMILSAEGQVNGVITINSGIVTIETDATFDKMVIAEGATLNVEAQVGFVVDPNYKFNTISNSLPLFTDYMFNNTAGLVVNGTLNIDGTNAAVVSYIGYINGNVNVTDGSFTSYLSMIGGTVAASENGSLRLDLAILDVTLSGDVSSYAIIAYPESSMTEDDLVGIGTTTDLVSTNVYVNGNLVGILYGSDSISVEGKSYAVPVELVLLGIQVDGVQYDSAEFYIDESMTDKIADLGENTTGGASNETLDALEDVVSSFRNKALTGGADGSLRTALNALLESGSVPVGSYSDIYIGMDAAEVAGTITVYQGMDLYIDGKSLESYAQTINGNVRYVLPVGEHTFSVQIDPGLTGTYEVTLDGQAISGGTFTIADNAKEFQIVVSGNLTEESVVIDQGGSSDNGLGLTDYLLIILVVLIVVMAIIVAMRLMRS